MASPDEATRPRQMEGSVNFLQNIPEIKTDHRIKRMIMHSPNVTVSLEGKIGYLYEVGGENGIEAKNRRNIEKLLPIHYSTRIRNPEQPKDKFQIIIAADGYRSSLAKAAGLHLSKKPTQIGIGIGYTVRGGFDPEQIEIWLGDYLSSQGYAYVIPFSKHEASLVSTSIGKNINQTTFKEHLNELIKQREWELQDEWVDFESWNDFSTHTKNNLFVIGNAGSFTDPAFGFGLKWAIKSAKLCARAIHENVSFDHLVGKELLRDFEAYKPLRKFFDVATNEDFDKYVKTFDNCLVRKIAGSGRSLFKNKWLIRLLLKKS
jgi:digeranylgeranylglycerophospholipid reductase